MAEVNTTLGGFGDAIAADTGIKEWCQTNYSSNHQVFENCDSRNEPGEEDCPLVILYPSAKSGGLNQDPKTLVIGVSCVVWDEGISTSTAGVIRFDAGRNVEAFRLLVFAVIKANLPANVKLATVDTDYDTIEQFPFVSATMDILLTEKKLIGACPYE